MAQQRHLERGDLLVVQGLRWGKVRQCAGAGMRLIRGRRRRSISRLLWVAGNHGNIWQVGGSEAGSNGPKAKRRVLSRLDLKGCVLPLYFVARLPAACHSPSPSSCVYCCMSNR